MEKGYITLTQLISWGVGIATAATGIFWAKVATTDSHLETLRGEQASVLQRTSKLEEAVETIKKDNLEIKGDIKELLRRVK